MQGQDVPNTYRNINPFFVDILSSGRMYELMDGWMDGWASRQKKRYLSLLLRTMPMYAPSYDIHNSLKQQPVLTAGNNWTAVSLHYCTVQSDRWLQTFRRNLIPNHKSFLPLTLWLLYRISLLSIAVNSTEPKNRTSPPVNFLINFRKSLSISTFLLRFAM